MGHLWPSEAMQSGNCLQFDRKVSEIDGGKDLVTGFFKDAIKSVFHYLSLNAAEVESETDEG